MNEEEKREETLGTESASQRDAAALIREKIRMRRRAVRLSSLPQNGARRKALDEQAEPEEEKEPAPAVDVSGDSDDFDGIDPVAGQEPFFGKEDAQKEEPCAAAKPEQPPAVVEIAGGPAADPEEEPFWRPEEEAEETQQDLPVERDITETEQPTEGEAAPKEGGMPQLPAAAEAFPLSRRESRKKEKLEEKERRQKEAEDRERVKREAEEAKEEAQREEREAKERMKREAEEERMRQLSEKKEARAAARQERGQEWKSLWRTAEFAMLLSFIVLAMDQVGIYGFLFVWLAVALAAASVALLLLGIALGIRRKRCGIVFFIAIAGILLCTAWFIFLMSERGLGVAPF